MIRRPPISTRLTHSFPTRRSSDLASAASITGLWGDAAQTVALLQAAIQGLPGPAGTPGTNGVDGIDGTDGKLVEFVWQRAAAAPTAPAGNGIPAGWSDDPPAGADSLWLSQAKQNLHVTPSAGATGSPPIRTYGRSADRVAVQDVDKTRS